MSYTCTNLVILELYEVLASHSTRTLLPFSLLSHMNLDRLPAILLLHLPDMCTVLMNIHQLVANELFII